MAGSGLRVAGDHTPAFVERSIPITASITAARSVAGDHTPAFVERFAGLAAAVAIDRVAGDHTPAFVERVLLATAIRILEARVAGDHTPAFVEREPEAALYGPEPAVSPGITPRPSLSVCAPVNSIGKIAKCRRGSHPGLR